MPLKLSVAEHPARSPAGRRGQGLFRRGQFACPGSTGFLLA
jgi:hypothetical protein